MSDSNISDAGRDAPRTKPARIIKRYPNRKLYDVRDSCYVTLEEIADLVREGEEVRVFDNKTHEDLTSVTLAQIIFEQEKKRSQMPLSLLVSMVRNGGAQLGGKIRSGALQVSSKAGAVFRRNPPEEASASQPADGAKASSAATAARHPSHGEGAGDGRSDAGAGAAGGGKPGRNGKARSKIQNSIDEWHRELDSRVHQTIEQLSNLPTIAKEMDAMERRIRELEARLEELDND